MIFFCKTYFRRNYKIGNTNEELPFSDIEHEDLERLL